MTDRTLLQTALFHGMDAKVVSALTRELETVERSGGQVFFTEGELGSWLYIVLWAR